MKTSLRRLLWTLLALALLAAAAWGVRRILDRPPLVEVGRVLREDVTRVLAVTGRVRPRQVVEVRPLTSGRLVALPKDEGDEVREGELLARVQDRQARAAVAQERAAVQAQRRSLEQARRDLERAERLHEAGLVAQDQLERARLEVERGAEELQRLAERVAEAEARLEDYDLLSPLTGRVLDRPVDPGQIVSPDTTLYQIATTGDPWVEARVDEIYLAELAEGMEARVAAPGYGDPRRRDEVWPATLVLLGDRVDPETGSVTVRLAFDGEAPDLPAGLSLDVNLTVDEHPDAVTVPRAAVADLGSEPWVLVVDGGRTARRPVAVIDWPAPRVVVQEGLEPGERVVLTPDDVPDGIEVRPVPATSESGRRTPTDELL